MKQSVFSRSAYGRGAFRLSKSMYNFTRETIDLEAIWAPIARMSDAELVIYGQSAAWMAEHDDRATWRVQLEEAGRSARPEPN